MSDGNPDVGVRVSLEGLPEALSGLGQLKQALTGLNGGSVPAGASSSGTSSGIPPAPPPPGSNYSVQGYDPNVVPPAMMPASAPGSFGGPSSGSYGSIVPPAPLPPGQGSLAAQHTGTMATVQFASVQTVNITAQVVNVVGGQGGGSGSAAGGSPGTTGGGAGGGNSGSGIPPAPPPPGGASWSGMWNSFLQNPTPHGAFNAIYNHLPLEAAAPIAAAGYVATYGMNYAYSAQRPQYETETQLMAAQARGEYVNPSMSAAMSRASIIHGDVAGSRALWSPLTSLPLIGGAIQHYKELTDWQDREREASLTIARGQADVLRRDLGALVGRTGLSDNDPFLSSRHSLNNAAAQFGSVAQAGLFSTDFSRYAMGGLSQERMNGALSTIYNVGANPQHTGMYWGLAAGSDPYAFAGSAGGLLSAEGNVAGLTSLQGILPKSSYDDLLSSARFMQELQAERRRSNSRYSILRSTGSGYKGLNAELGFQSTSLGRQIEDVQKRRAAAPPDQQGDYDDLLLSLRAEQASLPQEHARNEYGQRDTSLGAAGLSASTNYTSALYRGAGAAGLSTALHGQADVARRRAAMMREQAGRTDIYDPATRQMFAAQAAQAEQEARILIPRQESQMRFGLDTAAIGVSSAYAEQAGTNAHLFGGPEQSAGALRQQANIVGDQLKSIADLLSRGNLSQEEQKRYQAEMVRLQTRQTELTEEAERGQARGEYSVAAGNLSIAGTEERTAFMKGVGGLAGQGLAFGVLDKAHTTTQKARDYVALLKRRGVSEDNQEMINARQMVAQGEQQEVGSELALAHTPMSLSLSRGLSSARYQEQVLEMMPGAAGNIRGALQHQVSLLEKSGAEKKAEYEAAKQRYGGKLPDYMEAQFQEEFQQIGLQQASAYHKLSYGWESRLVSQALGTPGNYSYIANKFSLRDAVGHGVINPHFGSNKDDLPFFLRQANEAGSIAGATGTPEGFALTALTGAKPNGKFGEIAGMPQFAGAMAQPQSRDSGGSGGGDTIKLEITLKWPDGSNAGTMTRTVNRNGSLGQDEDLASLLSRAARGQ